MKCPVCYLENENSIEYCEKCGFNLKLEGQGISEHRKQHKKKNREIYSLTGFSLGLLSIMLAEFLIVQIVAIVCSLIGLRRKENENWQAKAGLLLGIIFLMAGLSIWVIRLYN